LILIVAAVTATAQEFRGSLAGKILDPNGAVVPGSKVDIKNVETGIVSTATSSEDGAYSFPLLAPGKYQLTVTKKTSTPLCAMAFEVRVADRLTLDVQLEIGVTAMVTTVASGLTLDTGTVSTGTVVTGKQISELPLTEGTAYQLATLLRHRLHRKSLSLLVQRQTAISRRSDPTAPRARTRSHSTVLRITRSMAASVFHPV
jgi:hypothetical protein